MLLGFGLLVRAALMAGGLLRYVRTYYAASTTTLDLAFLGPSPLLGRVGDEDIPTWQTIRRRC